MSTTQETPFIPQAAAGSGDIARAGVLVNRDKPIRFEFDGRTVSAFEGQTIGAALYAAGVRIFSRSFKYHRPRGLFCVSGACPNCMMNVDGRPNVRVCTEPVRNGQQVRPQNAWPSLEFDALSIFDKLDRFLPIGFYYKRFYRPRFLWPLYERVIRRVAGLGVVDPNRVDAEHFEQEHLHTDVLVVGAGPAGLAAAVEATRAGAAVLVLERMPRMGGHLLYDRDDAVASQIEELLSRLTTEHRKRIHVSSPTLASSADSRSTTADLQIRLGVSAFGVYDCLMVGAVEGDRLLKIRARRLIVATGRYDRPLVFHNNDLPGVFLGRAVLRLIHLYGVKPGREAVVVTDRDDGYRLARDLAASGITVAAIVELRPRAPAGIVAHGRTTPDRSPPVHSGHVILAARGKRHVQAVVVARANAEGTIAAGSQFEIPCDLVCVAAGGAAASELLYQSGCKLRHDPASGEFLLFQSAPNVFAAGDVAGTHDPAAILLEGRLRGAEAAQSLGLGGNDVATNVAQWSRELNQVRADATTERSAYIGTPYSVPSTQHSVLSTQHSAPGTQHSVPSGQHATADYVRAQVSSLLPAAEPRQKKRFICLCEDVTEKDLCDGIAEGFDNIETLKRYSTVSMGPCQGKVCALAAIEVCAQQTGRAIADVGTTTSRPPVEPVSLGVLAAGHLAPTKRTPMHAIHDALGCIWTDAGEWKRPEVYTSIEAEYRAVRERVGVIDVGTLGKIELIGPDAAELLDRVYLNNWRNLKIGRTRYGVMCTEEGIIFDDGTCGRLADQHYFMTTTTGNTEAVFQWLLWWKAVWGLNVEMFNVTGGYAAVNVAGPKAREVITALTANDVSATALPYMALAQIDVAGVPCRVLRVGFVGELGYEIHCPAQFGEILWNAIIEAGRPHGIAPFGVEAQRGLRLDKQHIIVGQDTDALSNPFDAGLGGMVKLDKPDFVGKAGLQRAARSPGSQQLVGFVIDGTGSISDEGCQVVDQNRPAGRVTSCRFSFTRGLAVGLAWVPRQLSEDGKQFTIRANGSLVTARVHREPFYDPDGTRLRS
jgi:sarcosine oxidase subunit alpha